MKDAITEFKNYTNNYLEYGEMIELKIKHTLRVVDICEKIANSLNLSEEEIVIAKIIGLLHDIGRFEQWKNYNTFSDTKSIDHGDYGVEILKKDNYIRKYIKDDFYDDIIFNSIKYHNKYQIPKDFDEKTKQFAQIIRDADKIDILYLFVKKELTIDIDTDVINPKVYESLLNKETIKRKETKTNTDRIGIYLGFIYDINYKYSFKYLKEKDYYNKIINQYKNKLDNEIFKNQLETIREEINNYIEVNLC